MNKQIDIELKRGEYILRHIPSVTEDFLTLELTHKALQEYAEWYHEEMSNKEYPFRKLAQKRLTKLKANGNDLDEYSISVPSEQDDASIGFI